MGILKCQELIPSVWFEWHLVCAVPHAGDAYKLFGDAVRVIFVFFRVAGSMALAVACAGEQTIAHRSSDDRR
jgi:hypothetical protein